MNTLCCFRVRDHIISKKTVELSDVPVELRFGFTDEQIFNSPKVIASLEHYIEGLHKSIHKSVEANLAKVPEIFF